MENKRIVCGEFGLTENFGTTIESVHCGSRKHALVLIICDYCE